MSDNIEQVLKNHIREEFMFDRGDEPLDSDLPLIQEGIIDSLAIFMLISFVEEQFNVKIQPEDVILDNFESIDAIKALIQRRM